MKTYPQGDVSFTSDDVMDLAELLGLFRGTEWNGDLSLDNRAQKYPIGQFGIQPRGNKTIQHVEYEVDLEVAVINDKLKMIDFLIQNGASVRNLSGSTKKKLHKIVDRLDKLKSQI